jgi:hypothetical protein
MYFGESELVESGDLIFYGPIHGNGKGVIEFDINTE